VRVLRTPSVKAHMEGNGGYLDGLGPRTQDFLEGNVEACPVYHGPGKLAEAVESFLRAVRVHGHRWEDMWMQQAAYKNEPFAQ